MRSAIALSMVTLSPGLTQNPAAKRRSLSAWTTVLSSFWPYSIFFFDLAKDQRLMTDQLKERRLSLSLLTLKTVVVHTITYFVAGLLAYVLGGYEKSFSQPPLSYLMRPTSDPLVMAGPLFQPFRGVIFASALYPLRNVLFAERRGWLILWWLLLALGVLSTFGPSPGSVEGLIYTIIPPVAQILGLWEVLLQSLLFSVVLFYWVNHPGKRWLNWTLGIAFSIVIVFPLLGLLVGKPAAVSSSLVE